MQKVLNKLIATILTIILVGANFMPTIVYAASEITQNAKTSQENVEFNASINDSYNATINVNENGELKLNVKVVGTGYLKDAKVILADNNYQLVEKENIEIKDGNTIKLNDINAEEVLDLSIPIKANRQDKVLANELERESSVTLDAIYVNEKGDEKKISKTLKLNLKWTADIELSLNQSLVRNIKYDGNKTMLSFKINEGIKENAIPYNAKKLIVQVPILNNIAPSNVIVIGDNIKYNYENNLVTIEKENIVDENGMINWNSQDTYMVTYIYETNEVPDNIEVKSALSVVSNGREAVKELENYTYELKEQIGSFVEAEIETAGEISKGYMYTNLNRAEDKIETSYDVNYTANIGYKDIIDKVIIKEQDSLLGSKKINSLITKKVTIERNNLLSILGEEGQIRVISEDGKEIGTLTKDNCEIEANTKNLIFETSKPKAEGNLNIKVTKAILDNEYNKTQLKEITEMTEKAVIEAYNGNNKISDKEVTKVIKLTEPTSEASIDVNLENLSTVVTNEDVILTATLKTNSVDSALYQDPRLKITLPEEVKNVNLKEAKLIYEDELQPTRFETNGNAIELDLSGVQTKYSNQATSEGTVLRIVADVELDNLAPSKQGKIMLAYSNAATEEIKQVEKEVGIVAPTEFITTNSVEVDGTKLTAQENDEKITKIPAKAQGKEVTIVGTIINNLGIDKSGVVILGTIPSKDNQDAEGKDLGSNFDTTLLGKVNLEGANAKIYYSAYANEKIDGDTWTEEAENAKAFKIVLDENLSDKSTIRFNYKVSTPNGLDYGHTSKATYAVYYDNNARSGNSKNIVSAKAAGVTTGEIPTIKVETSLIDRGSGKEIANLSEVQEGTFITYKVKVSNTGKERARNVKAVTTLPEGIAMVVYTGGMTNLEVIDIDTETKTLTMNISGIEAEKDQEYTYNLVVTKNYEEIKEDEPEQDTESGEEGEETEDNEESEEEPEEPEPEVNNDLIISTVVTAENVEGEVSAQKKITVIKGNISGFSLRERDITELKAEDESSYSLEIRNFSNEDQNNIEAKIVLPEELEITNIIKGDDNTYEYDENTNTITFKIPTLKLHSLDSILIDFKVKKFDNSKNVSIEANIKCDGMNEPKQIPKIEYSLLSNAVEIKHTSNISEGRLTDKDELIYYIDVKNNTNSQVMVDVLDAIPEKLGVTKYITKDSNGEKTIETQGRNILINLSVNKNESTRISIYTKPYSLKVGNSINIENKPVIKIDGKEVEVNAIQHTIRGSSNQTSGEVDDGTNNNNPGDNNDDDINQTTPGTYIITGMAWLDKNSDGKKDDDEEKLSGITAKLYNKDDEKIALDINNNELIRTTNSNGRYSFTNLRPGDYIVVIEYNDEIYEITNYKAENLVESEDSDFVNAKIDNKNVAATNTIAVIDSNVYNIDLGLVYKKKFDLKLDKTIRRITVTNTQDKVKTRIYDFDNKAIAKVELANTYIDFATVTIEYSINVTNEGQVPGYAKQIADYIPSGMTFNSELNTTWYVGNDGNAYNTSLANTIINPGETKEIRLVLTRKMSDANLGTIRNTAEIVSSYNEQGISDIDSIAGNKKTGEDDMSSADTVIGTATGRTTMLVLGIAFGMLSIIAISVYGIKKYIIRKVL